MASSSKDVFVNCPFDDDFAVNFQAMVFGVIGCGFRARCAREMDDAAETRIEKLYRIIEQSRYGLHDLSRTELDPIHDLPRFNMPLELGIFLGARRFGDDDQKQKRCAVFDTEQFRFQRFISDLAGMDVKGHSGDPKIIVQHIREFLSTASRRKTIPTSLELLDSYDRFTAGLAAISTSAGLDPDRLLFPDYERLVRAWVKSDHGRRI